LAARASGRDAALDLVKWMAMATMLLDHLRYVWPDLAWLVAAGRFAFPFFCLALAANVLRMPPTAAVSRRSLRYLALMLAFALVSEMPYRWLIQTPATLNIFPTLALGLLIALGIRRGTAWGRLAALAFTGLGWLCSEWLMYGVFGALLPAAALLALRRPGWAWLTAVICALANLSDHDLLVGTLTGAPYPLWLVFAAAMAPLIGVYLLTSKCDLRVAPVGKWAYAFYPVHLSLLLLIRMALA
jgi:hypothetical protein